MYNVSATAKLLNGEEIAFVAKDLVDVNLWQDWTLEGAIFVKLAGRRISYDSQQVAWVLLAMRS